MFGDGWQCDMKVSSVWLRCPEFSIVWLHHQTLGRCSIRFCPRQNSLMLAKMCDTDDRSSRCCCGVLNRTCVN
jgi:hypothetical protein